MENSKVEYFYDVIKKSGEFDEEFYIQKYPEVEFEDIDPIMHYITVGVKKMYNPSRTFNTYYYIQKHKDIKSHLDDVGFDNFNPLVHYISYGKSENRVSSFPKDIFGVDNTLFSKNSDLILSKLVLDHELLNEYIKEYESNFNSLNELINLIFSNCDIKAKGTFRYKQLLNLEILRLFDKICLRHDFQYWLDYDTLLGAVRHNGFIPWINELSVGMLRKDFLDFIKIFKEEFNYYSISDKIDFKFHAFDDNWQIGDYIESSSPMLYAKISLIDFDVDLRIFIYDFVSDEIVDSDYFILYEKTKKEFIFAVLSNKNYPTDAIVEYNNILHVTENKSKWIINAIDSHPSVNMFKSSDIFEIDKIKFEDYIFSCPKNVNMYLYNIYGNDFLNIPKNIFSSERNSFGNNYFDFDEKDLFIFKRTLLELKDIVDNII